MLPLLVLSLLAASHGGSASAAQARSRLPSLPIGVNYGANADNLPLLATVATVATFLATKTTVNRVKLFDANPTFLDAFATNAPSIVLAVSIPNSLLPIFAAKSTGLDAAWGWVRDNLSAHIARGANVTLLLAGNEILGPTVVPDLVVALLPAMRRLARELQLENLPDVRTVRRECAALGELEVRHVLNADAAGVAVDVEEADVEDSRMPTRCTEETENRDRPSSPASYSCATNLWMDATVVAVAGREILISAVGSTLAKPSWSSRKAATFRNTVLILYPLPFAGDDPVAIAASLSGLMTATCSPAQLPSSSSAPPRPLYAATSRVPDAMAAVASAMSSRTPRA